MSAKVNHGQAQALNSAGDDTSTSMRCEGADLGGVGVTASSGGSIKVEGSLEKASGEDWFEAVAATAVAAGDYVPIPNIGVFHNFRVVCTAGTATVRLATMDKDR